MKHLFTYGAVSLEEAPNVRLMETEIGMVPEEWESTTLGEVVTLQRGKDLPKSKRSEGNIPVIGSNGVVGYHSESIENGIGVFVGRSGSVGKVTWIDGEYWALNTTLWCKNFHGNNHKFVYYFLSGVDLSKYASGVSVPTLNRNLLHPIKVGLPQYEEQQRISIMLSQVDSKIEQEENHLKALDQLFKTLLNNLMTGKIRVQNFEVPQV